MEKPVEVGVDPPAGLGFGGPGEAGGALPGGDCTAGELGIVIAAGAAVASLQIMQDTTSCA